MASILPEDVRRAVGAATGGGTPAPSPTPRQRAAATAGGIPQPAEEPAGPKPTITRDSDPVLSRYGYTGPIRSFNERVAAAVQAAESRIGYRPAPGLIFDLVRSPLDPTQYPDLFGLSPSKRANAAETVLTAAGAPRERRPGTFERVGDAIQSLVPIGFQLPATNISDPNRQKISELEAWLRENPDHPDAYIIEANLRGLRQGYDPGIPRKPFTVGWLQEASDAVKEAGGAVDSFFTQELPGLFGGLASDVKDATKARLGANTYRVVPATPNLPGGIQTIEAQARLNEMSLVPTALLTETLSFTKLTFDQLGTAALLMPVGFYMTLRAPVMDLVLNPIKGDWSLSESKKILSEGYRSTIEMIKDPAGNPGNLLLFGWGATSGLAGGVARLGAAAEVVQTAGGLSPSVLARAGVAIVQRPRPQVMAVANEYVNLSENAAFRVLQRWAYGHAGKRLATTLGPNGTPSRNPGLANRIMDFAISPDAILSRAGRERVKAEYALATWRAHEVTRMARGAEQAQRVMTSLMADDGWRTWWKSRKRSTKDAIAIQRIIWTAANDSGSTRPKIMESLLLWKRQHERYLSQADSIAAKYDDYKLVWNPKKKKTVRTRQNVLTSEYVRRSQRAQLTAIDYAIDLLNRADRDPDAWAPIDRAINYTRSVAKEAEWEKISAWDMPMDVAIRRTAAVGAMGRGEPIYGVLDGRGWILAEIDKLQDAISDRVVPRRMPDGTESPMPDAPGDIDRRGPVTATRIEKLQDALDDPRLDSPTTAAAVLRELDIDFSGEPLPLRPINDDAFYVKVARAPWGENAPGVRVPLGPYGLRVPIDSKLLPELQHRFTGAAIEIGDFRIDATNLTAESYRRVVRATFIRSEFERMWAMANKSPNGMRNPIPIRNIEAIKPELRGLMARITDEGQVSLDDAARLTDDALNNVLDQIFPSGRRDPVSGRLKLDKDTRSDPSIRYIEETHIFSRQGEDHFLGEIERALLGQPSDLSRGAGAAGPAVRASGYALGAMNEGLRAGTLYLRPAYAINALGNAAFLLVSQGFMAPVNFGRAVWSARMYGDEVTFWLDHLAGENRTRSYLPSRKTGVSAASQKLSDMWSPMTDRPFRRASVIYRLRQQGIKTREDFHEAMISSNPEVRRTVRLAAKRARKDMVDFDNLNPFERAVAKNAVFIYAWFSRSAVWSATFLRDHPVQAQMYAWAGQATEDEWEEMFGGMPEIVKRMGFFQAGWDDDRGQWMRGANYLLATTSWVEMARPFVGLLDGTSTWRDPFTEVLGPAAKFVIRAATGRDDFGREYEQGGIRGALGEAFEETPFGALQKRSERQDQAEVEVEKPTDIALTGRFEEPVEVDGSEVRLSAGELPAMGEIQQEKRALEKPLFKIDSWVDVWGPVLAGQLLERYPNPDYLEAKFWTEQGDEDRHRHEIDLIKRGVQEQAKLLDRPIPPAVMTAVDYISEVTWRWRNASIEQGPGGETLRSRAEIALGTLDDMGLIDKDELATERGLLREVETADQVKTFLKRINRLYGGGAEVADWTMAVDTVAQFRKPGHLEGLLENLREMEMGDFGLAIDASQDARDEYGRRYLEYQRPRVELEELANKELHPEFTNDERATFRRQIQILDSENGEPVTIDGVTFPSFAQMHWAIEGPDSEVEWRRGALARGWEDLSTWEKQALLGREVKDFGRTWASFKEYVARQRDIAQADGLEVDGKMVRSISAELQEKYAKGFDAKAPGFHNDWKLAQQPNVRRYVMMRHFQQSPLKDDWYWLFGKVEEAAKYLDKNAEMRRERRSLGNRKPDWEIKNLYEAWAGRYYDWLESNRPDLHAEVDALGGKQFLMDLLD